MQVEGIKVVEIFGMKSYLMLSRYPIKYMDLNLCMGRNRNVEDAAIFSKPGVRPAAVVTNTYRCLAVDYALWICVHRLCKNQPDSHHN